MSELSDPAEERIARRVVELLRPYVETTQGVTPELVDAATLAAKLGVSRETVYRKAKQLGGRKIGDGPKAALRFDLAEALRASEAASSPPPVGAVGRRRPRRRTGRTGVPLLPVAGEDA